jgi:hypothetical protein
MRIHNRLAAAAAALALTCLVALPIVAGAATQKKPPVKAPKSGSTYTGHHPGVTLSISGKSVQIFAVRYPCKKVKGNTSLQDIKLHKGKRGYTFKIKSFGIVTYSDSDDPDHPDQNGAITLNGRFSRKAKTVVGHVRVQTPRCDSGKIAWSAKKD